MSNVLTVRIAALVLITLAWAPIAHGQESVEEVLPHNTVTTERAKVLSVKSADVRAIPGTDTETIYQTLRVQILSGPGKGEIVTAENDYLELEPGDVFFLTHTVNVREGLDAYSVLEPDRLPALGWLLSCFVFVVLMVAAGQGFMASWLSRRVFCLSSTYSCRDLRRATTLSWFLLE